MAIACPVDFDTGRLRYEIQEIYARVATDPSSEFHFHRAPVYAEYFDPFKDTSKERVARKYGVRGVNVHAPKS
jgi:hypothetical protein